MNFAGPAHYACVVVDDDRLVSFVAGYFLHFEHCDRTDIDADGVAVTFRVVYCDLHHGSTPVKFAPVLKTKLISS